MSERERERKRYISAHPACRVWGVCEGFLSCYVLMFHNDVVVWIGESAHAEFTFFSPFTFCLSPFTSFLSPFTFHLALCHSEVCLGRFGNANSLLALKHIIFKHYIDMFGTKFWVSRHVQIDFDAESDFPVGNKQVQCHHLHVHSTLTMGNDGPF